MGNPAFLEVPVNGAPREHVGGAFAQLHADAVDAGRLLPTPVEKMRIVVWKWKEKTTPNPVADIAFEGVFSGDCVVTGESGPVPEPIVRRVQQAFTVVQAGFTEPLPEFEHRLALPSGTEPIRIGFEKTVVLPWEGFRCFFSGDQEETCPSLGVLERNGTWFELVDLNSVTLNLTAPFAWTRHPDTNEPIIIGWVSALKMIALHRVVGVPPHGRSYTDLAEYQRHCKLEKGRGFMANRETRWMLFLALVYGYDAVVTPQFQIELFTSRPLTGNFAEWEADPANVLPVITPV